MKLIYFVEHKVRPFYDQIIFYVL